MNTNRPEPGKLYSLTALSKAKGQWAQAEVEHPAPPTDEQLQARIAQERERAKKAELDAKIRAALPAEYPFLIPGGGHVNAAKNIRIELKKYFPSTKFSVTSKSFSMGNSIDIRWTDGPTTGQVDAITDRYENSSFDAMQDLSTYIPSTFRDVFGGAKFVSTSRTFSERLVNQAILKITEEYGIKDLPTFEEYDKGNARGTPFENTWNRHDEWQSLIGRKASETSLA